jgi:hypothetical protein
MDQSRILRCEGNTRPVKRRQTVYTDKMKDPVILAGRCFSTARPGQASDAIKWKIL